MVTRQAQMRSEKRRSIRLKTDSMQTRMKMDRKRKRAVGTVTKNVRWSSVFYRERTKVTSRLRFISSDAAQPVLFVLWSHKKRGKSHNCQRFSAQLGGQRRAHTKQIYGGGCWTRRRRLWAMVGGSDLPSIFICVICTNTYRVCVLLLRIP